jgi:hypothetical protein
MEEQKQKKIDRQINFVIIKSTGNDAYSTGIGRNEDSEV